MILLSGTTYTRIRLPQDEMGATGAFDCTLHFIVKDCDPSTGDVDEEGYEESYSLEPVELTLADHMQRTIVPNFGTAWDEFGVENENQGTYGLGAKSIQDAVDNIVSFFGMQPLDKTEKAVADKNNHLLLMSGVFRGNFNVLVRCKFALGDPSAGVAMRLEVRSDDADINETIIQAM